MLALSTVDEASEPDGPSSPIIATPASSSPLLQSTTLPRAQGLVRASAKRLGGRTVLSTLRHQGSAKALFPKVPVEASGGAVPLDGVLLNTAGGVAGGDRFQYQATAERDAWLRLSTQTAERGYRARSGEVGWVEVRLRVDEGARLDWTPQETILFDHAAVARRLDVDLAESATFLAVEPFVLGRGAMGETVRALRFTDQWRIRRGGRLVYADAMRLVGDAAAIASRRAVFAGATAAASLVFIGRDAEAKLASLRTLLAETDGASLIRTCDDGAGVLVARMIAPNGYTLRRRLIPVLEFLGDAPIPKVWSL